MSNDKPVTTNEIMEFLKDHMVVKEEFHEELAKIRDEMATKDDLTGEIGKLRSEMIDYIGKQNLQLKTDLVLVMRGEDKKLATLVDLLVAKKILTNEDAKSVIGMDPFLHLQPLQP